MAETSRFSRRVFFVEDDGTIRRISSAAYERLLRHDPATVFPKVPGRAVRCAIGDVEIIDWRPTEIYSMDFVLVYFDSTGALDRKREAAEKRLVDQIIRAADRSSKKRPFAGRNHPACKRLEAEFRVETVRGDGGEDLPTLPYASSDTGYAADSAGGRTSVTCVVGSYLRFSRGPRPRNEGVTPLA